ncbi:SPOR domain-containing protein [Sulfitobacter sp. F26204]|nr:SPOR domain-containing protein [Sulfitobacter sp. F26204]MCX7560927.1 SPOR domain-containing protein [Sulfitobacter sp. F26204]
MKRSPMQAVKLIGGATLALALLAGCDENGKFNLPLPKGGAKAATTVGETKSTRLVERDVEAPEVFSATDQGLWDGRPSLGGVWVAHPDVTEPERVIIRNEVNGKFVIGALFRKERDLPGPKLQISSDTAAALGILAGAPAPLNVTALRREETAEEAPVSETTTGQIEAPAEVSETSLDPIAAAGAAIDAAAPAPAPTPKPVAPRSTSSLAKPFVQLGIFSVEDNADRVAKQMRGAGMVPLVKQSEINGKPFWRVVVGPANTKSELNTLIKAIKAEGFSDAYAVTN